MGKDQEQLLIIIAYSKSIDSQNNQDASCDEMNPTLATRRVKCTHEMRGRVGAQKMYMYVYAMQCNANAAHPTWKNANFPKSKPDSPPTHAHVYLYVQTNTICHHQSFFSPFLFFPQIGIFQGFSWGVYGLGNNAHRAQAPKKKKEAKYAPVPALRCGRRLYFVCRRYVSICVHNIFPLLRPLFFFPHSVL